MNEITVGQYINALAGPHQIEVWAGKTRWWWDCRCGADGHGATRDLAWVQAAIHVQQEAGK